MRSFFILFLSTILLSLPAWGECQILDSKGDPVKSNSDSFFKLVTGAPECPKNVFELRAQFKKQNFVFKTSLVANRGFHNVASDSLSLFEWVTGKGVESGDLFFGHFTGARGDLLIALQEPEREDLMVELFAADAAKDGAYNFYELIGPQNDPHWFYRGDSFDIDADLKSLHLTRNSKEAQFGTALRCSGCHLHGGPIAKELKLPHNDWWVPERPLKTQGWRFEEKLGNILSRTPADAARGLATAVVGADELTAAVDAGNSRLNQNKKFQTRKNLRLSLREQLRPLFCPMELNLESDSAPLDGHSDRISVPSGFFADTVLGSETISVDKRAYRKALEDFGSQFPEVDRADADHAWLTPVKAASDQQAGASLVAREMIGEPFRLAVLSVDQSDPIFSNSRCELLKEVPEEGNADWLKTFKANLEKSPRKQASFLRTTLELTPAEIKARTSRYLTACKKAYEPAVDLNQLVGLLFQRRGDAFKSPISQNPRRQILEPGFRVIFPILSKNPVPAELKLDPQTCLFK